MHETTIIEIGGEKVEVDADLAPLILELNRLGLKTRNSCQGGGKRKKPRAYISIQLDGDTCFEFNPKYNSLTGIFVGCRGSGSLVLEYREEACPALKQPKAIS